MTVIREGFRTESDTLSYFTVKVEAVSSSLAHSFSTDIGIIHIYSWAQNKCYIVHISCLSEVMFIKVIMPKAKKK